MPRKPSSDLLDALARTNQALGRLGVQPFTTVDEARRRPEHEQREILEFSKVQLEAIRQAMRGYLG